MWSAPRRTSRGGQRGYSDWAIETCLMRRTAYPLGLRQTPGLMGSIGTLMGLDIRVPDYSTLSRRANGVSTAQGMRQAGSVPVHRVVDSTGLKIFGEGDCLRRSDEVQSAVELAPTAAYSPTNIGTKPRAVVYRLTRGFSDQTTTRRAIYRCSNG